MKTTSILLKYALIFIFILSYGKVAAQSRKPDVIIKTDNSKVEAIIQEVSSTTIKYKKISDPTGPNFTIDKNEVSSILYGNGEVESLKNSTPTNPENTNGGSTALAPAIPPRNEFERDIQNNDASQLRDLYKTLNKKASNKMVGAIVFNTLGLGAVVGGIVLINEGYTIDNRTYYSSSGPYKTNEVNVDTEMRIWGYGFIAAGAALTGLSIVKYVKFGMLKSKAGTVRRELLRRREPLTQIQIQPGYNPMNQSAYVGLKMTF